MTAFTTLSTQLVGHVGSFLTPAELSALSQVDKETRAGARLSIKFLYQRIFGTLREGQVFDTEVARRLVNSGEAQPRLGINHNTYSAPTQRWERWKWVLGFKNSLDDCVERQYRAALSLLENTQATSIPQLKHQMQGFWHTDRVVKDYTAFKRNELEQMSRMGLLSRICFACLRIFFKYCCRYEAAPSITLGATLADRALNTSAKIGAFTVGGEDYDVVAYHQVFDERGINGTPLRGFENGVPFYSWRYGKTCVGIARRGSSHNKDTFDHKRGHHHFEVSIGRRSQDRRFHRVIEESTGNPAVYDDHRSLELEDSLELYDGWNDRSRGSDRLIDQKLIQVVIEMAMQNRDIVSIILSNTYNAAPLLLWGGFRASGSNSSWVQSVREAMEAFRAQPDAPLFPPFSEENFGNPLHFRMEDKNERHVHYTRGEGESWADIIANSPILNPGGGSLPEYWVKEPNIVAPPF